MRNNDHASNIESRGASLRSAYVCRPCEVLEFVQIEGQEPFVNVRLSTHFEMLPEQRDADLTYVEQSAILEVPIAYLSTQQYAVTIRSYYTDSGR